MINIPFSPPDITNEEIDEVIKTLKSGWITTGPKTKELEREISKFCNTRKSICLNSATACMEMCLRMLGVGPGDEVITTAYTYTATASVIDHVGARVVLVDTEDSSFEMSYDALEKAITRKTKVIIPVDIAGVLCDYDKIFSIVENKRKFFEPQNNLQKLFSRIIVLSDSAHSFGATRNGYKSGNLADFTSFSFHAVKNLTTAEGGCLTWKDLGDEVNEKIYNYINLLSLHGQTKDALAKNQLGSWEYDIIYPAYKCNMTDIQAAIGLVQLKRYNQLLEKRKQIVNKYKAGLSEKIVQLEHKNSSMHLMLTKAENKKLSREETIFRLAELGISTNVHYKPLPMLTAYKNLGFKIEDFPNAYKMFKDEITIPLHTKLTDFEVNYIIENYNKLVNYEKK
ncbi:DegT/DnrJ/EryC1/StrS aminotransferase family protein [Enterococcus gallinarum]|uniref:DegT/DnrJ/EryC1/StrS family aminotransferase n=1 Tax=Enterococcus gallinarum TaxID=1353 RepID=UPI000F4EAC27|nr:DegT/DnrJ/EryC1/StrS aminotransferase family protein [Enterococcus gallinarum]ROY85510.1 DegT/DnrJ/EryC1/StrS aminotransferase family protein [Enterococcus gallinarum]